MKIDKSASVGLGLFLRTVRRVMPFGVVSDTTRIQAAIAAMAGVGEVRLGAGSFAINAPLSFPSNAIVYGSGRGATILQSTIDKTGGIAASPLFSTWPQYGSGTTQTTLAADVVVGANTVSVTSLLGGRIAAGLVIDIRGQEGFARDLYGGRYVVRGAPTGGGPYTVTLDRPIVFPMKSGDRVDVFPSLTENVHVSGIAIRGSFSRAIEFIRTRHCTIEDVLIEQIDAGATDWIAAFDSFGYRNAFRDVWIDGGGALATGGFALEENESSTLRRCRVWNIGSNPGASIGGSAGIHIAASYQSLVEDCHVTACPYGLSIESASTVASSSPSTQTRIVGGSYCDNVASGVVAGPYATGTTVVNSTIDRNGINLRIEDTTTDTTVVGSTLRGVEVNAGTHASSTSEGVHITSGAKRVKLTDVDTSGCAMGLYAYGGATVIDIDGWTHVGLANAPGHVGATVNASVMRASRVTTSTSYLSFNLADATTQLFLSQSDIGTTTTVAIQLVGAQVNVDNTTNRGTYAYDDTYDAVSQIHHGDNVTITGSMASTQRLTSGGRMMSGLLAARPAASAAIVGAWYLTTNAGAETLYECTNSTTWTARTIGGSGAGVTTGLDQALPEASAGLIGSLYLATDTGRMYECVSATAWNVVGIGPDKATFGPCNDTGFLSATITAQSGAGVIPYAAAITAPVGAFGYTWACTFHVDVLPGVQGGVLWSCGAGSGGAGWGIACSAGVANKMRFVGTTNTGLQGIELPGAALTVGAHAIAIALDANGALRYAFDGVLQAPTAILGAAWSAPSAGHFHRIGRWPADGFPFSWGGVAGLASVASALVDADLVTLTSAPSTYRFGAIATAMSDFQWRASWQVDGANVHRMVGAHASRMAMSSTLAFYPPVAYR